MASDPTEEKAATLAPEPTPEAAPAPPRAPTVTAPAAPPQLDADPASSSNDAIPGEEIEPPVAEVVEPDVSAAEETIEAWAAAWEGQRVDDYLAFYSSEFRTPGKMERGAWESRRRTRILRPKAIRLTLGAMSSTVLEPGRVHVAFEQTYQTETYRDKVRKTLELVWEDDRWKIVEERSD